MGKGTKKQKKDRVEDMKKIKCLDHGYVELVDVLGDDYRILQSARISTGGVAAKGDKQDRGLIRYLYKNQHMSPFEMVVLTFKMKAPNFVMKQILRHRTFSFNEYSQRYSKVKDDYYVPKEWRLQGVSNHQGSGEPMSDLRVELTEDYDATVEDALSNYNRMLNNGVAKEMARMVLPSSMYTEFYFTVDLRNLLHFLELRMHEHAQFEIREFANGISRILHGIEDLIWTMEIFDEMTSLNYKLQEKLGENISIERMIAALDLLQKD